MSAAGILFHTAAGSDSEKYAAVPYYYHYGGEQRTSSVRLPQALTLLPWCLPPERALECCWSLPRDIDRFFAAIMSLHYEVFKLAGHIVGGLGRNVAQADENLYKYTALLRRSRLGERLNLLEKILAGRRTRW